MTDHEPKAPKQDDEPSMPSKRKLGRLGTKLFSAWLEVKGVLPHEKAEILDKRYLDSLTESEREQEYKRREEAAEEERRLERKEFRRRQYERNRLYKEELEQPDESFELVSWLSEREKNTKRAMVEIGYGTRPYIRTRRLTEGQSYIGLEANINPNYTESIFETPDKHKDAIENHIKETRPDEDITFINIDINVFGEHVGTQTDLQDSIADEVLIDNVFDDPRVNSKRGLIRNILLEARRLLAQDGKIIVHDSVREGRLSPQELRRVGLRAIAVYPATYCQEEWSAMEAKFFSGDEPASADHPHSEEDYYAILVRDESPDFDDTRLTDDRGVLWYSRGMLGGI